MKSLWGEVRRTVETEGAAALVAVATARGSAPREAGARMVVRPDGAFRGTIGGGALEWRALARAQSALAQGRREAAILDQALGPDLGQCCGGHVRVSIEAFFADDIEALRALEAREAQGRFAVWATFGPDGRIRRTPIEDAAPSGAWREDFGDAPDAIALFGAGHVGRALVMALAPLDFRVLWSDERPGAFPAHVPANATPTGDPSLAVVDALEARTQVLVMTHSHALDLAIVDAALRRPDLAAVGVIGSDTKRARFVSRLKAMGHDAGAIARLRCPIGIKGLGKEPAAIAAGVAVECLQIRAARGMEHAPARLAAGQGA